MRYVYMLVVLLLILSGCTQQSGEELRIGVILHLSSNEYANVGQAMKEGIDLAVSTQNRDGGINGKRIEVIYEDDQNDLVKAVSASHKLIEIDKVDAVIVSTYGEAMAIGPIFEQAKVPIVVLWDANADIESLGDYVFSTGVWTENAGTRISDFSFDELDNRKVAIIHHNTEWSKAIADYFSKRFASRGGEIVFQEGVNPDSDDFRTVILKAEATNPDAIFAPIDRNHGNFFKQLSESQYDGDVLSADAMTQQGIDDSHGGAEGVYYTSFYAAPDSTIAKLYRETYAKDSDQLVFVGFGYDGAISIISAAQMGDAGSESIKDNIYRIRNVQGSFGSLSFDLNGTAPKYEGVFQVRDGKEKYLQP